MASSPTPQDPPVPPSPSFPPRPPQPTRRASTSSVTIPIPGKSILKKPPPPPAGLLSRITSGMGVGGMSMGGFGKLFGGNSAASPSPNPPTGTNTSDPLVDRSSEGTSPPDPALKRAHFILPHMAVVYPISSNAPPRTPTTQMEKKAVEDRERDRRRRVVSGESSSTSSPIPSQNESSVSSGASTPLITGQDGQYRYGLQSELRPPSHGGVWWSMDKVEAFYNECCAACDEPPDPAISRALLRYSSSSSSTLTTLSTNATATPTTASLTPITTTTSVSTTMSNAPAPRTLDLTGVTLTPTQAEILADVLCIEWGLRTLVLCECNLNPIILKPILHALLLNNTLIFLSVASNNGLAAKSLAGKGGYGLNLGGGLKGPGVITGGGPITGWVVLEAYLARSNLKVLDLSRNRLDKKAMEGVVRGALGMQDGANMSSVHPVPSDSQDSNTKSSSSSLISLTLDASELKSGAIDVLARAVRSSPSLRTLSLRNCRIGSMGRGGGIAVSLMIRDWPDTVAGQAQSAIGITAPIPSTTSSASSSASSSRTSTPTSFSSTTGSISRNRPATLTNLELIASPPGTPLLGSSSLSRDSPLLSSPKFPASSSKHFPPPPRHLPVNEPPPVHPSVAKAATPNMQTTYTPYVPRVKRAAAAAVNTVSPAPSPFSTLRSLNPVNGVGLGLNTPPMSPTTPMAPTLTAVSRRGGVTAASANTLTTTSSDPVSGVVKSIVHGHEHAAQLVGAQPIPPSVAALNSASAALLSQVRALDALPRIGSLRTLDLRGNELRNHVSYLSQVLKRNRTLKTLNLQDNKLDPKALAIIAEALKYNAALEELDLGKNPCCGVVVSPSSLASSSAAAAAAAAVAAGNINSPLSRTTASSTLSGSSTTTYNAYAPSSASLLNYRSATNPSGSSSAYSQHHHANASQANSNSINNNNANSSINLGLEGIHALRLALALNTTLTRLSLSATHLGDAGAIALAEWMGEYRGLRWLDLTRNSAAELGIGVGSGVSAAAAASSASGMGIGLGEAGVMALAQGVKVNRTLRCLDVEVPPGMEGYARLSREILNTCIRNVEASSKKEQQKWQQRGEDGDLMDGGEGMDDELDAGLAEAKGAEWKVTKDPVHRATDSLVALKHHLEKKDSVDSGKSEALLRRCRTALDGLAGVVSGMLDSSFESAAKEEKMREVLGLSDELSGLIDAAEGGQKAELDDESGGAEEEYDGAAMEVYRKQSTPEAEGERRGKPHLRVDVPRKQNPGNASTPVPVAADPAAFAVTDSPTSPSPINDNLAPMTPSRSDKGKARAPPEPVRHEPVLSPTAVLLRNGVRGASSLGGVVALDIAGSEDGMSETEVEIEDEFGEGGDGDGDQAEEPEAGVRSRNWVAEEGEVFRKGNVLLGPEEMEGEYAGEELRRELLEAMVERPAPRQLDDVDDYETPFVMPGSGSSTPLMSPATPTASSTPLLLSGPLSLLASLPEDDVSNGYPFTSPADSRSGGTTPTQDLISASATPRAYVSRTRSASANGTVQEMNPGTEEHGQPKPYISRRRSNESFARGSDGTQR
ncbi:hypothetical protein D9757_013043 [Collybiopsis confluens]|uniref:RNI-like protein n=1 Tax=Collybiopsis confluens TaxID=2823264 RepID=A0A8H5LPQ6_9AGAR|nr:hypothetical protein D9757_013043 [Collybiopsis confluens]